MAWPPPVLPINRTNATPQLDTHAADHNALALAVNDTVARVKQISSGAASGIVAVSTNGNGDASIPLSLPGPFYGVVVSDASQGGAETVAFIIKVLPDTGDRRTALWVRVFLHDGTAVTSNGSMRLSYVLQNFPS
jgi:hypothetical protein